MFVEKNELFVFDWEYARMLYPPMLDKYHYFTQTAIFEKHWDAKEIIKYISSPEAQWVDKESYILYLLDIISRFTIREKGNIDEHMMYNTYNMGLGMILAVDPADVDKTMEAIRKTGDKPYVVGSIEEGEKGVTLC